MERRKRKSALTNDLEVLYEVINLFSGNFSQDEELAIIVDSVFKQRHVQACGVLVKKTSGRKFEIRASQGLTKKFLAGFGASQKYGRLTALCAAKDTLVLSPRKKVKDGPVKFEKTYGSMAVVPLRIENKPIGILFMESRKDHVFTDRQAELLKTFAMMAVISLTREGLVDKTHELEIVDDLTALYNIRYFRKRLAIEFNRARAHDDALSSIIINIDNFEKYCEKNGDKKGEAALVEVATIIRNQLRSMDIIARYSMNQVVASLYDCSVKNAAKVAGRVIDTVKKTKFSPNAPRLGVSIGIAGFPDPSVTGEDDLLDSAEEAVFQAFRDGGNTFKSYS